MRRFWKWAFAGLVAGLLAVPFFSAGFLRGRMEVAIERALNRKVTLEGQSHLRVLPWPAFVVEGVTITEDPKYSLEPFAYVTEVAVEPSLWALAAGRLEARKIRLTEPSVNLMRSGDGWNVQSIAAAGAMLPDIEVRGGRLNFKQGNEKSAFYLANVLADISAPTAQGDIGVFVEAEPARTDRGAQGFGEFSLQGSVTVRQAGEAQIDFGVELKPSAIHAFNFFFGSRSVDFAGRLSTKGRLKGPVSAAEFTASTEFDGLDAGNFLPFGASSNRVEWKGMLDLVGQRFSLDSGKHENVRVRMRARDLFQAPRGAILLEVRDIAFAKLLDLTRKTNTAVPGGLEAQGKFSGVVGYSIAPEQRSLAPVQGMIWFDEAELTIPENPVLRFGKARVVVAGPEWSLGATEVTTEGKQSATIEARWGAANGALRMAVATQALGLNELRNGVGLLLRAGRLPLLQNARGGSWQGNLQYTRSEEADPGTWSGTLSLHNSLLSLEGLREGLQISTALARFDANRVDVRKMRAEWNGTEMEGGYTYYPGTNRASEIDLVLSEGGLENVAQALGPAMEAPRGILERMRLRQAQAPEWLRNRALRGRVVCKDFKIGTGYFHPLEAMVDWRGTKLEVKVLRGVYSAEGSEASAVVDGVARFGLYSAAPLHVFEGRVVGWPAEDAAVRLEGKLETPSLTGNWWEQARAEGVMPGEGEARKFVWREGTLTVEVEGFKRTAASPKLWPLQFAGEP
jgi:hypothetical protein